MRRKKVLIVEDVATLAIGLAAHVERAGFEAIIVGGGAAALREAATDPAIAAMLLDIQLPDTDGLTLMREQPHLVQRMPIIVITADGSLSRAIEAMRLGAFDFIVKPVSGSRLSTVLHSAVELRVAPIPARERPDEHPAESERPNGFVGSSPEMQEVYRQIEKVAPSRATVFITGESGTGKEVCAETIHRESGRGDNSFIAINCGAIPENLLESELFGHLKGSFTGAVSDRVGAVQAAHKGTLFLDEICEMALPLQVKLLRFLQSGTVQRVGANKAEDVDVRIICATNRDPEREVAEGRFREDLFYRLAVIPIHMPPLRVRQGDLAQLSQAFLTRFAAEEGKKFDPLGGEQLRAIEAYHWPGNVRELQNALRRVAVLNDGPNLPLSLVPRSVASSAVQGEIAAKLPIVTTAGLPEGDPATAMHALRGLTLDEVERLVIEGAISQAAGSLPAAARALGVSPSTLYRKRERWTGASQAI